MQLLTSLVATMGHSVHPRPRLLGTALAVATVVSPGLRHSAWAPGQQPATLVAGEVVEATTGRPVGGANVTLISRSQSLSMVTGSGGTFSFKLAGATVGIRLQAEKPGYLPGVPRQMGPHDSLAGAAQLDVRAGESRADVRIRLWAEGTIAGRVTDAQGAPVVGATVLALKRLYTGEGSRWIRARVPTRTDDTGAYKIDRLVPGDYIIAVRRPPRDGSDVREEPPTFYPGTRSVVLATPVSVNGAAYTADVVLDGARGSGSLSGRLVGGDPAHRDLTVRLIPIGANGATAGYGERTIRSDAGGEFHFAEVPEGLFRVKVAAFPVSQVTPFAYGGNFDTMVSGFFGPRPPGYPALPVLPDTPTWVADVQIAVGEQRNPDIEVPLRTGAHIAGRVVFEGSAGRPAGEMLTRTPVLVRPADGGTWGVGRTPDLIPQSRIEPDDRFMTVGLPPGDYVMNVLHLGRWHTASITVGGREALGRAIALGTSDIRDVVITLSDRSTTLSGTVHNTAGQPTTEARVIVFPRDPKERNEYFAAPAPQRVRQVFVGGDGVFTTDLPAGDYLVAAITTLPPLWMTPSFLESLAGGAKAVHLEVGGSQTVSVTAR